MGFRLLLFLLSVVLRVMRCEMLDPDLRSWVCVLNSVRTAISLLFLVRPRDRKSSSDFSNCSLSLSIYRGQVRLIHLFFFLYLREFLVYFQLECFFYFVLLLFKLFLRYFHFYLFVFFSCLSVFFLNILHHFGIKETIRIKDKLCRLVLACLRVTEIQNVACSIGKV